MADVHIIACSSCVDEPVAFGSQFYVPSHFVNFGEERIGYLAKPTFGKGFFMTLTGTFWNNSGKPRYRADDVLATATHVSSLREAERRAITVLLEKKLL